MGAQPLDHMKVSVAFLQRWIRRLRDDDLHQARYVRHDVLATNASKLGQDVQDVRRDSGVDVVGLRQ